jgi:hypothetical protein
MLGLGCMWTGGLGLGCMQTWLGKCKLYQKNADVLKYGESSAPCNNCEAELMSP